jgi:hypothetical protein
MALLLVQLLPEHAHLCAQRRIFTPQPAHLLLLLALEVELYLLEVGEDLAAAGPFPVEDLPLSAQSGLGCFQVGHLLGQTVHLELGVAHLIIKTLDEIWPNGYNIQWQRSGFDPSIRRHSGI